jgi:hypothetical protein
MMVNVWDFRKYLHCLCNRIYGTQAQIRTKFYIQSILPTCNINFHQNLLHDFGDKTDMYRRSMTSLIIHIIQGSIKFTCLSWNKSSLLNIEYRTLDKALYDFVFIFVLLDMSSLRYKLSRH